MFILTAGDLPHEEREREQESERERGRESKRIQTAKTSLLYKAALPLANSVQVNHCVALQTDQ